ncbi:hypothetical protein FKM82_030431 [Ascaphus truei]
MFFSIDLCRLGLSRVKQEAGEVLPTVTNSFSPCLSSQSLLLQFCAGLFALQAVCSSRRKYPEDPAGGDC